MGLFVFGKLILHKMFVTVILIGYRSFWVFHLTLWVIIICFLLISFKLYLILLNPLISILISQSEISL